MKSYSHDFKANTNQNKPCDRTVHHFGFGRIINIFGIFWQSLVCSKCYIHHHIEFCSNKTRKCNPPTKYRKNSTTYIPHYDFGTDNTQNVYTKNPHCYSVGEMSRFMATAGIWGNRYPNKPEVQIVLERRLQLLKLISRKTALVHTTQKNIHVLVGMQTRMYKGELAPVPTSALFQRWTLDWASRRCLFACLPARHLLDPCPFLLFQNHGPNMWGPQLSSNCFCLDHSKPLFF